MAPDPRTPLLRIEQETAALTQRWGEQRAEVLALAIAEAETPRGDDDVLADALRASIDACDRTQAELIALDAQRRTLLRQPPDRGYVSKGLAANRAAWLTASRLKLLRHAERADVAADDARGAGNFSDAARLRVAKQRLEVAAAVIRDAVEL